MVTLDSSALGVYISAWLISGAFTLFCRQVAQKVCVMFQQCHQGKLAEVRQQISQLAVKKASGRAKVTPVKPPAEDAENCDDDDDEEVCPRLYRFFKNDDYYYYYLFIQSCCRDDAVK